MSTPQPSYRRYCKALTLTDDPQLIADYERAHHPDHFWPEITQGMKDVGILNMEIYRYGTVLFMIMDTVPDFDHDRAMRELATKPRQAEWEAYVAQFQQTDANASAKDKWQLLDRIYKME
jgi:L-rhamnose mutarotase